MKHLFGYQPRAHTGGTLSVVFVLALTTSSFPGSLTRKTQAAEQTKLNNEQPSVYLSYEGLDRYFLSSRVTTCELWAKYT